jgi:hypothetical protein
MGNFAQTPLSKPPEKIGSEAIGRCPVMRTAHRHKNAREQHERVVKESELERV